MSNIILLSKVLIKNNVFAFSSKKGKGKSGSSKGSAIGFLLLIIFCVGCIGGPIIFVLNDLLKAYDLSELVLSFVLPIGGITSIIFGVFSIISVFYFNKDSENLLPLPIKSSELLVAKFIAALVSEYLILLMFIFPIIFGVGIGIGASILYYVYSIFICLLMPIIPSVIMSLLIMIINKVFKFGKKKDLFMYVMTGLILVFAFAYSFGLEFILESSENEDTLAFLSGDFGEYINTSKWLFPFFNSAVYSLVHYNEFLGFASIMTFIGLNVLSLVILYLVGDKLYIKGLTKDGGTRQNKKENIDKIYKTSKGGVMKELIKKEWLTIKRTPTFMLNVVIMNIVFPIIFGVSFAMGFSSEGDASLFEVIDFSNSGIFLICIGILLFLCSMSSAASSAISREGSSAYMMKNIPVSYKKQMDAKVYFSLIIDLIILFGVEIVLFLLISIPWYYAIIINVPIILVLLIANYLSLLLDLRKPRLDWKEESEAVKQNFNVFLGMMIFIAFTIGIVLLGVAFINSDVNIFLMFAFVSVILLVLYILMNYFIKKYQVKLFSKVG